MSEPANGRPDLDPTEPVNEMRARLYERLMEAQEQIAQALYGRGVPHERVLAALDDADERLPDDERREDLYLSSLARFVGALGGCLEVRAVLGEEAIVVRRDPG